MKDPDPPAERLPRRCTCGGALGAGVLAGLCPPCLLRLALEDEPEPADLLDHFGGYELLARLGAGGMGVVYKARQVSIDRVVALKRIKDGELADAEARRRFHREARAAASLDHPGIVRIYDVGEHDGQPYFTMPYLTGGTLAARAKQFAEPRRAAALVAKLARAVHEGHRSGILHRDLKPENILFDDRGEPCIADFGVAKRLTKDGSTGTAGTGTGVMAPGTIYYMAPEQTAPERAKRDTAAVDVWSLGVILYELLAGKRPFSGPTPHEIARRAADDAPESLAVDPDLETVCLTCLHKEPGQRYISAEALADDLERYLRDEPVDARRPGRLTRAVRWCRRHPTFTILFGSATLALITLTLFALASARAQERARRDEVLATNVYAARAVAGTVLAQLDEYAGWVAKEARDPRLAAALAHNDYEALQELCEGIRASHGGDASHIAWWFLIAKDGSQRAHAPLPHFGKSYYVDFSFRDYFRKAMALSPSADRPVYVSRSFCATSDDRYKIAIASPIPGEDGAVAGVLAAEIETDRHLGNLELSDDRRLVSLTVRRDRFVADDPMPDDHILLVHGGVEHGERVDVDSAALRRLTARREAAGAVGRDQFRLPPAEWVEFQDDYQDPLANRASSGAADSWLAGVAPVGGTELAVIVQTRLEDATRLDHDPLRVLAAWSVGGAVLLCVGLFVTLRSRTDGSGSDGN